jgi:trimethyllysine dioxygenase
MATVSTLVPHPDRLSLTWADGVQSTYPWVWLRDHSHDPATIHPVTQQRQLHSAGIDPALRATDVEVRGTDVVITWAGTDLPSTLPVSFLHAFRTPRPARTRIDVDRVLWDATTITPTPTIAHERVMTDDEALADWLELVARYGFAIVEGTPPTVEATEALVRRVAYVRETIFGGFWEFTDDLSKADTAYTNLELLSHTDGTYSHDAPGLQLLHCLHFDGTGGQSTMVDGFRIAAELRASAPHHAEVLRNVAIPGQYLGDGSHLVSSRPVLRHDHTGELVQVSYNHADRAPFLLAHDEMVAVYEALRAFDQLANDPAMQWRHVLAPGEAMLFDNWRVLHGRAAYTGSRRLCGAYLNHEDFESRLRLAGRI